MATNSNKEELNNIMEEPDAVIGASGDDLALELDAYNSGTVDVANNTFRELCKTLEYEQIKLRELEARRCRLQEEVDLLKKEIDEEKLLYSKSLEEFNITPMNCIGDAAALCSSEKESDNISGDVAALDLQISDASGKDFMMSSTDLADRENFQDEEE
ncbi:uncharacterized protein LOC119680952 isoform X2 [Teleopsis dalmanni]|uniref:uncharacterized protein LOC119680952 isoform X2 n=1 Tax=Teleopsis dalmanni TaxID=139649 RepID=UPI0018CD72C3|nr:uncharacterized protein LOC119680952 isoform X2 [Teleopsis dalmanni]